MKWNKLIPFCGKRMLHYECGWNYDTATKNYIAQPTEWRPQAEFTATLRFVKWHHGRSAAYADFEDPGSGITYPVSLASTGEFMALLVGGCITGRWIAMKRGQNYLLEFLGPTP